MKKINYIYFLLSGISIFSAKAQTPNISYSKQDSIIAEKLLDKYSSQNLPINDLVIEFGKSLIGTPYVAGTLEREKEEQLIINLRELDCTTYVETVLALALTAQNGSDRFKDFASNLQKIRYRNGEIDGYPSRLHYFSDWIQDNSRKGFIKEVTPKKGSILRKQQIGFMSSHTDKYPPIAENKSYLKQIQIQEKQISVPVRYIPKDSLTASNIGQIQNGDIIAITTSIEGLDITHVGIAIFENNSLHLLHASLGKKEVVIENAPLSEQLQRYKSQSGIRVVRPIKTMRADKK